MSKNAFTNPLPCGILINNQKTFDEVQPEMLTKEQLSRIRINGYKSIRSCDLELKNINVLIGTNGAGKSNFISVFSLIQNMLNEKLQLTSALTGIDAMLYKGSKITDKIGIEAYFGNNSYGFELSLTENNRFVFSNEFFGYYLNFENQTSLGSGHEESKWRNGTKNAINDYVQPILERQAWRVYHFHDTGRTAKVKQEHSLANSQFFAEDARNLAAFLYRLKTVYPKHYNDIRQTIQIVAPYFDDFVLEPQELNNELILLRWKQKECDDVFYASQLSDGTLRFICLATLLLQPEDLQPATIIIDEPELGLHPFALTVFAEMVHSASLNKQIIVSTQSADLLSDFDPEDIIVVNNSKNGTIFRRLDEEQLREWLEDDYSLGDLWKKNVIGGRLSV